MPSNSDNLAPRKAIFILVYTPIFFSTWVGIPYFVVSWVTGQPVPEWFTAVLVIVGFCLFGPPHRRMLALSGPYRRFHAWAYQNKPSAE